MPAKRQTADEALARAQRDAKVIELRRANWQWADIGAEVGLTAQRCHQIFEAFRLDIPNSVAESYRAEELDLLARGIRDLLVMAMNSAVSERTRAELWKEVRMHSESRRKLLGLDAPVKREVEIWDSSSEEFRLRSEIAEMEREIAAADAVERARGAL
jgi:hypothetical protein